MEWGKNDPRSKSKPPAGKPKSPSRLQKHAPAALHLDASKVHPCSDASSLAAIPLLSPIPLVSPFSESPPCQDPEYGVTGGDDITGAQPSQGRNPVVGGWQHPATSSSSTSTSKLYSLFHTQCSLVDSTR